MPHVLTSKSLRMVVQGSLFQTLDWFWRFLVSNLRQTLQYTYMQSDADGAHCTILDILLCFRRSSLVLRQSSLVLRQSSLALRWFSLVLRRSSLALDGPRSHFDGPRSPFEGPRWRFDDPSSCFDDPRSQFDGPHSRFNDPRLAFRLARYTRRVVAVLCGGCVYLVLVQTKDEYNVPTQSATRV